jgi:hypothetical protein
MSNPNEHNPTYSLKVRIKDLAVAGIPLYLIARIVELDDDTVKRHYKRELDCAEPEQVERISKIVAIQAENGNEKSQALYLKTKGAKYGWVEKQVVETVSAEDTQELREKIAALEEKYCKDY